MESKVTTIWNKNFICIMLVNALFCFSHWCVNPLVSTYAKYLGAGDVMMGLLTGMFFGIALAMRPVSGPAMTKLDKKKLMIATFALGIVVNLGYAFFPNISAFFAFRFLHGVQYSFIGSLMLVMAGDALPDDKMASGMGIYGVSGAIPTAVGPSIGIALNDYGKEIGGDALGYKLVFLLSTAILVLLFIPLFMMKARKYSEKEMKSTGKWYQNIVTLKALPISILMTLIVMGHSLFNSYMVPFAEEAGIENASLFFTVMALVMLAIRPIAGKLTDKKGYKFVIVPTVAVYILAFVCTGLSKSLGLLLVGAVFAAIGYGSSQPAIMSMCLSSVPPVMRGVASNTLYIGMDLGFFIGPLLGSIVYSKTNYATMYVSAAVIIVAALIFFLVLWPVYVKNSAAAKSSAQEEN